jgi:hypothetical protein
MVKVPVLVGTWIRLSSLRQKTQQTMMFTLFLVISKSLSINKCEKSYIFCQIFGPTGGLLQALSQWGRKFYKTWHFSRPLWTLSRFPALTRGSFRMRYEWPTPNLMEVGDSFKENWTGGSMMHSGFRMRYEWPTPNLMEISDSLKESWTGGAWYIQVSEELFWVIDNVTCFADEHVFFVVDGWMMVKKTTR